LGYPGDEAYSLAEISALPLGQLGDL